MMRNKKGSGWLTFFVNHILSMILIVLAVLMLGTVIKGVTDKSISYDVKDLHYNLLATRILDSADCLAYTEPYLGDIVNGNAQGYYRVRAGIIDMDKFGTWADCLGSPSVAAILTLDDFTNGNSATSNPGGATLSSSFKSDYYFVKIYDSGEFHDGIIKISIKGPD